MGGRQVVALQTYLIHFRDRQLALAVGAELEDRLARDGRHAVALIPAGDGLGLTGGNGEGRGASRGSYGGAPQVVALYEEGLLVTLESLGLTAYVGVCPEEEAGVVRWADGGAMLLPVATARDLIDAVADHTPWSDSAASMTQFASSTSCFASTPGPTRPALSRKLAVAGIAGPLLLTGVPAAAAATSGPVTHQPSAKAGVSALFASKIKPQAKTAPPATVPASIQALINEIETALKNYLQQTGQASSTNAQALQNQITQLINALINAQKTSPQPAQAAQPASGAQSAQPAQSAQTAAARPTNASTQTPGSSGSQSQQNPQDQSQQDPSQQNPQDQSQQDPSQQNPQDPSQQDPSQQNPQDQSQQDPSQQNPQDPNQSQSSTTSPNSSTSQSSASMPGSTSSGVGTTGSASASQGGGTTSSGGGTSSGGSTS